MKNKNNIELLAPAGSPDTLKIAINNGANAVYLGLKGFNARNKAENFDETNLREYVKLSHLFGVKVYVTVNTLVTNAEMPSLMQMVKKAVECKVDAFLVQDLGVLSVLRQCFNGIELHSSTQMGVHNLQGAQVAKSLGCSRVVLSREATKFDIEQIHKNCNVEIEYFVQGALCVAFSGNCYFSSLNFGESGNRGKCLQSCRLCYTATDGKNNLTKGYLLSTTDLCLLKRTKELALCGVNSLKIEGRLRRGAYVAQAVSSYRNKLSSKDNFDDNAEIEKLKKVFYRGKYNEGYYFDNNITKNIINPNFQNHRGIEIGLITKVEKFKDLNKITIKTNGYTLNNGDGLKLVDENQETSLGVGNPILIAKNTYEFVSKHSSKIGSKVYLTLDNTSEEKLVSIEKKIPISISFFARENEKAVLKFSFNDISAQSYSPEEIERSKNAPATENQIFENLNKLNDTNFEICEHSIDIGNVFIPKSVINEMRRKCVSILEEKIIEKYEKLQRKVDFCATTDILKINNNIFSNHKNYVVVDEKEDYDIPENSNIVLAPSIYNLSLIEKMISKYKNNSLYLSLPLIKRSEDEKIISEILSHLDKTKVGLVATNIYGLNYISQGFRVVAGYQINVTNSYIMQALASLGVEDAVQSIESDLSAGLENGLKFSGYPALMTFTHCPYKTSYKYDNCADCKFNNKLEYINERGHKFKIRRYKISNCYFELLSDKKIENNQSNFIDLR